MRTRILATLLVCLSVLPLAARAQERKPIPVVATFSVIADFVRNIGGDRVTVTSLVGPDGDAHVYAPTPQDARTLGSAQLVVMNGLKFEGWIDRLVKSSGTKARIVTATRGIKPIASTEADSHGHEADPHAWHDIANARIYVANIRDGLSAVDPDGKVIYDAAATAYLAKLDLLEADVRKSLGAIPADRRRIITTHDAFGYFGKAYGLTFEAPIGVSTDSEPSARDVARIIRQIRQEKVPAIFLENITDPRLTQRIAAESGARIGGTLYSDGLSPPNGPAGTYIDMVRHNIRELTAALSPQG